MDAKALYHRVCELLKKHPEYRDNDKALCAHVWMDETDPSKPSQRFFTLYVMDMLPSAESIARLRRKAQEERPELRGALYHERHSKQEKVKTDLKQLS